MLSPYKGARYRAAASPDLVRLVEADYLHGLDVEGARDFYVKFLHHATDADLAYLGAVDRFFLLTHILGRKDAMRSWLYDRCREVELEPDGHLDLWARYHYKSTIITFAGVVQEIINNPDVTVGIFSHTKAIATAFAAQIMREFEGNHEFRTLYPDICWKKPRSEAPVWSTSAFTVRRSSNPKEATVEAHGLVDGQPTSKHFQLRVYDDVVTRESVTTPEQVKKTTEAYELSDNLGTEGGRVWGIGTRYTFGDTWGELINRGVLKPRIYPATDNGKLDGTPVLLSDADWAEKKKVQRSTLNAQMLQNPLSGKERAFRPEWFKPWWVRPLSMNVYVLADPSRGQRATSDRTAMAVIGLDANGNKYLLDGACHRMTLSQRWDHLKHFHKKWSATPGINFVRVGYERFGQQSDDEYFQERMRIDNYSFAITELAWPREGGASKIHRVERLQPDIEYGAFLFPGLVHVAGAGTCTWEADMDQGQMRTETLKGDLKVMQTARERGQEHLLAKPIKRKDTEGVLYDVTRVLMEQCLYFPFGTHDDMVDAASRIYDIEAVQASIKDVMPEMAMAPDE